MWYVKVGTLKKVILSEWPSDNMWGNGGVEHAKSLFLKTPDYVAFHFFLNRLSSANMFLFKVMFNRGRKGDGKEGGGQGSVVKGVTTLHIKETVKMKSTKKKKNLCRKRGTCVTKYDFPIFLLHVSVNRAFHIPTSTWHNQVSHL